MKDKIYHYSKWSGRYIEEVLQDLRYGGRTLAKKPVFTIIAAITLAFGIGANTAVFSIIDAFLLRPLPVKNPEQMVFVQEILPNGRTAQTFPYSTFEQFRDHNQSFSGIFAYDETRISASIDGQPEMVDGDFVSGSYFDVLGVSAVVGRAFTAADDQPDQPPVAVISHAYWERRFARSPSAIGKTIYVGKIPFSIIGITSPEFFGRNVAGRSADLTLPMYMQSQLALRDHNKFGIMARLKPGVTFERARNDLGMIYRQVLMQEAESRVSPQTNPGGRSQDIVLKPGLRGADNLGAEREAQLSILLGVVGVILLIACVNLANLLFVRASARQKEIAVRFSLGASRGRLIRQLLTESVLLATLGGGVGLLFAEWIAKALLTILSYGIDPVSFDLQLDLKVLTFTCLTSLLSGVLFGLTPALAATKVDLTPILKGSERGMDVRPLRRYVTKLFVILQVALSLALLIGAGLLIRSLQRLYEVDTGFERKKILTMWAYPSLIGYDQVKEVRLYKELLEKMRAIPGVQSVSLSRFSLTAPKGFNYVGPQFFETMGINLLEGRDFLISDNETAPRVAIISESTARKFYPINSPIGKPLREQIAQMFGGGEIQIVGVVRGTRGRLRRVSWEEAVYMPYTQAPPQSLGQVKLFIRTIGNPTSVIPALRREVQSVEKDLALQKIETQAQEIEGHLGLEQSMATLLSFFGLVALVLASIGLYGTVSYTVGGRTKDFGIRIALGSQRKGILWMVLREALIQVLIGVSIGIVIALAATRLLSSMLFGIEATDPMTISLAVLTMLTIALMAAYIPARRATKVDPIVALRHE